MLAERREKFKKIEIIIGQVFSKIPLSPNQYTIVSIPFAFLSLYSLSRKNLPLALTFFIVASFLDLVDGAVARISGWSTKKGAFLDTICDRYVEGIVLLGFLFLKLPFIILPAAAWIFLALFGGFATTYAKAAAKEKELVTEELKTALLGRAERVILIYVAMILGIFNINLVIYPIIILAILSNISALQRIYLALNPPR